MKDGGPAFPCLGREDDDLFPGASKAVCYSGLSIRDWFAGMALQGMLSHLGTVLVSAEMAYHMADAMLNEREK